MFSTSHCMTTSDEDDLAQTMYIHYICKLTGHDTAVQPGTGQGCLVKTYDRSDLQLPDLKERGVL